VKNESAATPEAGIAADLGKPGAGAPLVQGKIFRLRSQHMSEE
jgi:hypothetical protein